MDSKVDAIPAGVNPAAPAAAAAGAPAPGNCAFLGFGWRPELVAHIERRGPSKGRRVDIDPRVRRPADELQQRLDAV